MHELKSICDSVTKEQPSLHEHIQFQERELTLLRHTLFRLETACVIQTRNYQDETASLREQISIHIGRKHVKLAHTVDHEDNILTKLTLRFLGKAILQIVPL